MSYDQTTADLLSENLRLRAELEKVRGERDAWEQRAKALWGLLDDIDTLDDAARGDDVAFRDGARRFQRKRFTVLTTDGYALFVPGPEPTPPEPPREPPLSVGQPIRLLARCGKLPAGMMGNVKQIDPLSDLVLFESAGEAIWIPQRFLEPAAPREPAPQLSEEDATWIAKAKAYDWGGGTCHKGMGSHSQPVEWIIHNLLRIVERLRPARVEPAPCGECGGSGEILNYDHKITCGRCGGSGKDASE